MVKVDMQQPLLQEFLDRWHDANDYIVAHTSGSTGEPKPIHLAKSDMVLSARATNTFFGIGRGSRLFTALSPAYIAGMMMVVRAEVSGAALEMLEPSNHFTIDSHVTLASIVPSQITCLIDSPGHVDNALVGGAPLTLQQEEALGRSGITAWASYGMTETVSHVALRRIGAPDRIYTAMPGITFALHGDGLLSIDAPHMTFGRIDTNDRVQLVDNKHFRWLGRADNVINSGGIKLQIEEIEERLSQVLKMPFYVKASPDEKWGEHVHLIVETAAQPDSAEIDAINKILDEAVGTLPRIMRPRETSFVTQLPRTSTGKIRRAE